MSGYSIFKEYDVLDVGYIILNNDYKTIFPKNTHAVIKNIEFLLCKVKDLFYFKDGKVLVRGSSDTKVAMAVKNLEIIKVDQSLLCRLFVQGENGEAIYQRPQIKSFKSKQKALTYQMDQKNDNAHRAFVASLRRPSRSAFETKLGAIDKTSPKNQDSGSVQKKKVTFKD